MKIAISNSNLIATIDSKGAELSSLKNPKLSKEYIWEGNPQYWEKHSPVLFPIVGTLKNNCYYYNDKKHELLRHGFARDNEFEIISQNENHVVFSLKSSNESKLIYPFDFEFQIGYTLLENELQISYRVINKDITILPFSVGAHPAFALPNDFEKYSLEFKQQETLQCFTLENNLLSDYNFPIELNNKKLPLSFSLFENDALIFKELKSKEISILENEKPFLKLKFHDFKNLGIWTKVNAPFICIEPWLGYSDTIHSNGNFLEKEGLIFVNTNESFTCQFSIEIL